MLGWSRLDVFFKDWVRDYCRISRNACSHFAAKNALPKRKVHASGSRSREKRRSRSRDRKDRDRKHRSRSRDRKARSRSRKRSRDRAKDKGVGDWSGPNHVNPLLEARRLPAKDGGGGSVNIKLKIKSKIQSKIK